MILKTLRRLIISAFTATLIFTACQNPFIVGLGENVDIDRPTVSLDQPTLGTFLRGTISFTGTATDDVGVEVVEISFNRGVSWHSVNFDPSQSRWSYTFNTIEYPAGTLSVMVRVKDGSGKQTSTEELLFTIDNDAPAIIFTFPSINPDTYTPLNPPTVGKNGAIFGTVTDREALDFEYPKIRFWRQTEQEPNEWISLRPGDPEQPSVFDFQYNLPVDVVGDFFLRVTARDGGGQIRTVPPIGDEGYRVVVVSGAPQVSFSAPTQAAYVRGTTTVAGTMSHETGNQPDILLRFMDRENPAIPLLEITQTSPGFTASSDGSGGYNWEYSLDTNGLPDTTIIAQVYAEIGGTTGFDNLVFNIDNESPGAVVSTPAYLGTVYSEVTIAGTASDNMGVEEVAIKLGSDGYLSLPGTYGWQHTFSSITYGTGSHAFEVDPETGEPQAGTAVWRLPIIIRVTDTAGNERFLEHPIYIDQDLDKPTVTILAPPGGSNLAGPVLVTGTAFDADPGIQKVEMQITALDDDGNTIGNVSPLGLGQPESEWNTVSGTTQWNQEINANGGLYSVTKPGGAYEGSGQTHNGRLRLRIRAVDKGGKEGNILELTIRLDETIPGITNVEPLSGSYERGLFYLTATVTDDEYIESVSVSNDGGTTYTGVYSGGGTTYALNYPVDTGPGGLNSLSEVRTFRIRVRDNANYTTISTVVVNIDNYWPDGELVTTTWDPMAMEGAEFQLRGNGWDRNTSQADNQFPVRGMETIAIYLEDDRAGSITQGQFYHLGGGGAISAALQDLGNGQGIQPVVTSGDHMIRIDRDHIGSIHQKAIEVDGSDFTWWTRVDTSALPDGPLVVHYLFTDRAGNRTHRFENGFIRNNPPEIGSVLVGTDLNYDHTVSADEQFIYEARFNARRRLYVLPTLLGGNGSVTWGLFNSTAPNTPLTLTDNVLDISGYDDGDYSFILRATDQVGIVVETSILAVIDQNDTVPPTLAINPVPVPGAGHVEPESPFNPARPSVSGTVTVSGAAWDNQRISEIRITAEGIGVNVLAAQWAGGAVNDLVSTLGAFTILSSSLDESTGHQVSWSYTWNTASHPDRAALGVSFSLDVQDFRTGSPAPISAGRLYDVVPYIASVSTDQSGIRDRNIRSANGRYVAAQSDSAADTMTILGFNLAPVTNGIRVAAQPTGLIGTTLQGDSLTLESESTDFTSLTVRKNGTASGFLTVVAGTTANPIPSINNINNNGLSSNREPSSEQNNPNLTDDRYLTFFSMVETGFVNGYYPEMMMNGNFPVFGFIDDSAAQDLQFSRGEITGETGGTAVTNRIGLIRGLGFQYYAFDRDGSGVYHQVASSTFNTENQYYIYGEYSSDYAGGGATRVYWADFTGNRAEANDNDAVILDSLAYDPGLLVGRYKNPRMIARGNSTTAGTAASLYMSFYDAATGEILYRNFQTGRAPAGGVSRRLRNTTGVNIPELPSRITGDNSRHTVAASASHYFDMGLTDDNVVVIAYFNQATGRTNLRYSTTTAGGTAARSLDGANPDEAVNFSSPLVVPNLFTGSYLSMYVETDGNPGTPDPIHIAAHDSSSAALAYIRFDSFTDQNPEVVLVDSHLSVGIWTDITVSAGKPYIGYYNNSETGTRDSVKLALFNGNAATAVTPGVNAQGEVTGNWEFMTVPAIDIPNGGIIQFQRVNIGVDPSGNPLVGYLADDIEYGRLLPPWP